MRFLEPFVFSMLLRNIVFLRKNRAVLSQPQTLCLSGFAAHLKGLLQDKSAIAICTKNEPNKTNRPSKEAVVTSFEGRILYIIFGTSYLQQAALFALGLVCEHKTKARPV